MSDGVDAQTPIPPGQFPPGWYPDAATPGRDRWWDGSASTRFTARTVDPSKAGFGVPYVHSMRAGANRILIAARVLLAVAALMLLFLIIVSGLVITGRGEVSEFVVVNAVAILVALAGLSCGVLGLVRSPRLGGKGVGIWAIVFGALCLLFSLFPLAIVLLATS